MKKIKYQTQRVSIDIANYGNEKLAIGELAIDGKYNRITGVAIHIVNDAGAANGDYKIGLQNDNGVIHDLTHVGGWATAKNDGTNPNERFKELNEEVKGSGLMQCKVSLPAQNLATKLEVDFCFRLEMDETRTS